MTNFTPRSYQQIQAEFFRALVSSRSPITDVSSGSVLSALSRSVAITHSNQELLLNDLVDSFYISTAAGADLDTIASDLGLSRKPGLPATGYVLATVRDEDYVIEPRQTFTDPNSQIQLQYVGQNPLNVTFLVEARVPVTATITGVETNLQEGTDLVFQSNFRLDSVVGSHRTTSGQACGSLSGGRSEESDLELRMRIADYLINRRGTTRNAIRNVIQSNTIADWVHIESPLPGLIQVWVDYGTTLSPTQLQTLKELAETAKPAGCVLTVHQPTRQYVDIDMRVRVNKNADQDTISANIGNTCQTYVLGIPLEGEFQPLDLLNLIQRLPDILSVELIEPQSSIQAETDSVLRIGNFFLTYELQ